MIPKAELILLIRPSIYAQIMGLEICCTVEQRWAC
jgi:hypothetical protein